jgi:Mg-chelatase subunit ChlD
MICGGWASLAVASIAVVAVVAIAAFSLRSRALIGRNRLWLATALRILAVLALFLALDHGVCNLGDRGGAMAAIDGSESVQLAAQLAARDAARDLLSQGTVAGAFEYGASGSDVGAAIAAGVGGGGDLYLASDGAATGGELESALAYAAAEGSAIHILPVNETGEPDAALLAVVHRSQVEVSQPFAVQVQVWAAGQRRGRIRIWSGQELLVDDSVLLEEGVSVFNARLRAPAAAGPAGLVTEYLDPRGPSANDVLATVLQVRSPRPLLHVGEAGPLAEMIAGLGHELVLLDSSRVPDDPPALAEYAGIVLNDVAAADLTAAQIAALDVAVAEYGTGLAVVGGPNSFTAGGYAESPLNHLLPVDSDSWRDQERSEIALLLLIDRSTSMAISQAVPDSKLALAREAAIAALELLEDGDQVAVVAFSGEPALIVPLTRLGPDSDRAGLSAEIAAIGPDGTTDIFRALNFSRRQLAGQPAQIRHIILITDGQASYGQFGALVQQARNDGISISTIAVGDDAELDLLSSLATGAGGRFHVARDPAQIPAVLTQEAELAKNFVTVSSPMQPRLVSPSEVFALTAAGAALPWLGGYVRTEARPQAKTVLASNEGEPILASWHYGRGPVVAWTSDLSGVWSSEWTSWDQFPAFTAALINQVSGAYTPDLEWRIANGAGGADLELRFADPAAAPTATALDLELTGSEGRVAAALSAVVPGTYRGRVTLAPGTWSYVIGDGDRELSVGQIAVPYSGELRPDPGATARLRRIAALTGGRLLDSIPATGAPAPNWLTAAIILLLGDTLVRRLRVSPRRAARQLWGQLRPKLGFEGVLRRSG